MMDDPTAGDPSFFPRPTVDRPAPEPPKLGKLETFLRKYLRYSTAGPALTRYYLLPRIKLHYIHSSDTKFHTHPWNGFSLIFGQYDELYVAHGDKPLMLERRRFFNRIQADRPHQVLIIKPVWTLFFHGKKINHSWHYGGKRVPFEGPDQERQNVK